MAKKDSDIETQILRKCWFDCHLVTFCTYRFQLKRDPQKFGSANGRMDGQSEWKLTKNFVLSGRVHVSWIPISLVRWLVCPDFNFVNYVSMPTGLCALLYNGPCPFLEACVRLSPISSKVVQSLIRSVFSESCKHRLRATRSLKKLNFELLKSSEMSFLSLLPSQELKVELLAQKAHFWAFIN